MKLIDKDALVAELNKRLQERKSIKPSKEDDFGKGYLWGRDTEDKAVLYFIDTLEVKYLQEEPVSKDRLVFKAIPRLLEMLEPNDRAKAYTIRLADALEKEGYITDAKLARESIKVMNGEKVAMATMDEEPVSEELCDAANDYGVNIRKGYPRVMDETDKYIYNAFKAGAKWQKNKMMEDAIKCEITWMDGFMLDYTQEQQDDLLEKIGAEVGDKVKLVIIKED